MNSAEKLLKRLKKVRGSGDQFTSLCPAHEDKTPSLAVRALEDGRVLIHCFGGCTPGQVMGAVGLTMEDLFPDGPRHEGSGAVRHRFSGGTLLRVLSFETLLVLVCARNLARGKGMTEEDLRRLTLAGDRIEEVMRYAGFER